MKLSFLFTNKPELYNKDLSEEKLAKSSRNGFDHMFFLNKIRNKEIKKSSNINTFLILIISTLILMSELKTTYKAFIVAFFMLLLITLIKSTLVTTLHLKINFEAFNWFLDTNKKKELSDEEKKESESRFYAYSMNRFYLLVDLNNKCLTELISVFIATVNLMIIQSLNIVSAHTTAVFIFSSLFILFNIYLFKHSYESLKIYVHKFNSDYNI